MVAWLRIGAQGGRPCAIGGGRGHILRSARRMSFLPWSEAIVELCGRCKAGVETKNEMVLLMP
mgnify:CR=1 FL=1